MDGAKNIKFSTCVLHCKTIQNTLYISDNGNAQLKICRNRNKLTIRYTKLLPMRIPYISVLEYLRIVSFTVSYTVLPTET